MVIVRMYLAAETTPPQEKLEKKKALGGFTRSRCGFLSSFLVRFFEGFLKLAISGCQKKRSKNTSAGAIFTCTSVFLPVFELRVCHYSSNKY